jgi:uncharacterized protein YkwD
MTGAMGHKVTALICTVGAIALAGPASAQACEGADLAPSELDSYTAQDAVLCLMNQARKKNGLGKLRWDGRLERAAQSHSNAMDSGNFFSHSGQGGSSPASRIQRTGFMSGARSWGIAENIRWGSGDLGTPRMAVVAWMRSAPHRAAMLSRSYRLAGVGVAIGSPSGDGSDAAIYTADFGYRR